MTFLVVNADDGGLAESTDDAILRCAAKGVVRAASVVAAGPTAARFVARAKDVGLELGLHVNLTEGPALAGPAPTLTDAAGRLRGPKDAVWVRTLDGAEVRAEVLAQWQRLLELGAEPTHVDGHNHVHVMPVVREALLELDLSLWVRFPERPEMPEPLREYAREMAGPHRRTDFFTGIAFAEEPTAHVFLESLDPAARVTEFMVHPGSRAGSPFCSSPLRDRETELLCSEALARQIENRGYRLAGFAGCG